LFSRRYPDDQSSSGSNERSPRKDSDEKVEIPVEIAEPPAPAPASSPVLTPLQLRRRELIEKLAKNPPKISEKPVIDLATEEEKRSPNDEWFEKKFQHEPKARKEVPADLYVFFSC
uniref:Uncharacterized protein n=1 Tax=Gongylonema pulchrum TaxID=637853 RepID=A0A183E729_9BILA